MKGKTYKEEYSTQWGSLSDLMENQKLYRQAEAKKIQHHQISFTKNGKGNSLGRKGKVTNRNKEITNGKAHQWRQACSKGRKTSSHKHGIQTSIHEERRVKCRTLGMYMKLSDQQLKTILCIYRLLHQNLQVTPNQKSTTDTCTKKKQQSNYNTNNSHQVTREQRKKGRKRTYKSESKTMNKMAIRTYMSIITLNGNRLNAPTKRQTDWLDTKTRPIYMLSVRNLL